jgi:hypothetical protein
MLPSSTSFREAFQAGKRVERPTSKTLRRDAHVRFTDNAVRNRLRLVRPVVFRYAVHVVLTPRQSELALQRERAERAMRIAAMLDRWAVEDVSDEPDWDLDAIRPMSLRTSTGPSSDKPSR